MSDGALLRAQGLGHRWPGGTWLFEAVEIVLAPGQVLTVLGPNGRGKTTFLRLLAGLQQPSAGTVTRSVRTRTAYVPQSARGSLSYTAIDMVVMGRASHLGLMAWPGRRDVRLAEAALERVGAAHLERQPFHLLSGGERQLVLLARALTSEARLLLLDEPMAALDLRNQNTTLRVLADLAREEAVAIVVTTHQPQHALALGQDVLILAQPGEHVLGPATEVLSEGRLSALYGLPVARIDIERNGRTAAGVVPLFDMDRGPPA